MYVTIPAHWVAGGYATRVCSRHGASASLAAEISLESSPAPWSWALLPLGGFAFLLVRMVTRKVVLARRWVFCDRCRSLRRARLLTGWGVLAVTACGVAVVIGEASRSAQEPTAFGGGATQFAALLLAGIVGWMALLTSRWPVIARARVSRDGQAIQVRKPASAFEAEVDAALHAASRASATAV